jgi:hypothetical protein
MEATRIATAELAAVMSANPKFANSQFHDFLSKVSTGELDFEDNQVVQGPNAGVTTSESASMVSFIRIHPSILPSIHYSNQRKSTCVMLVWKSEPGQS